MREPICHLDRVRLPVAGSSPVIDWQVRRGDVWLIDGSVGSGKSTLIKLLAGLIRPAAGRVSIFGSDLHRLAQRKLLHLREKIGVIFERDGLIASWTVGENLLLPLRYRGTIDDPGLLAQRIETELTAMGEARTLLSQRVSHLTGRQRRRIALLRILLLQPELVLMDELPLYLNAEDSDTEAVLARLTESGRTLIACAPSSWARHFPFHPPRIAQLEIDRFCIAADRLRAGEVANQVAVQ
ncbi:MAG: ATP-binding cassette domain-containing protein [Proteobacteria bacterium]|nr:MAG: ATP-binding cassette domain-containing protein [Pseudomonadota bacterium]QKK12472.1 MAG: ATP-binding cassette domain-containing protein [Pseudomonadota bacterium]